MSDDLEEIAGVARTGGNLRIQISKALNVGVGKREDLYETEDLEKIRDLERTGDLEKRGGGLFPGVKNFDLDSSSLKSTFHKFRI